MSNINAMVSTDALAPATMPTIDADAGAGVQPLVDRIKSVFDGALAELIEKRDQLYADAIRDLELEGNQLSAEYDELEASARALEVVLPAARRVASHEADLLMVSGSPQDAKAKLTELSKDEQKPITMRQRQKEIVAKLGDIDSEKQAVTREVFEQWHKECQRVVRAAERGLFVTLLTGLEQSFYEFQARTGTGTSDNRHRPLLHQGHITGLTADGRSAEWAAGHKWYG